MKGKGIFRGIQKAVGSIFSKKTKHYPDPILRDPHLFRKPARYKRKNDVRPMISRGNLGPPPCKPGSISYHDMLVRKLGRRRAEQFRRHYIDHKQNRVELILPSAELLVGDWDWRG